MSAATLIDTFTDRFAGGGLSGITALVGATTKLAKGEEYLGKGQEVARDAVAANAEIKAMAATYDLSIKDKKMGLEGTPVILPNLN